MKPGRQYHCERCDESVTLPADLVTLPRCGSCGRDSLVLLLLENAPKADPTVTPEKAVELFKTMRAQVALNE